MGSLKTAHDAPCVIPKLRDFANVAGISHSHYRGADYNRCFLEFLKQILNGVTVPLYMVDVTVPLYTVDATDRHGRWWPQFGQCCRFHVPNTFFTLQNLALRTNTVYSDSKTQVRN